MMENKRILYDFCPRCSGLMKNGVCVSCGYEKKGAEENPPALQTEEGREGQAGGPSTRPPENIGGSPRQDVLAGLQTPARKKRTGIIIGFCIAGLLFLVILCLAIYLIVSDVKDGSGSAWNSIGKEERTDQPHMPEESRDYAAEEPEPYVPDASDDYYEEVTDALRGDLFYRMEWQDYEMQSEDGTSLFYALYPVVTKEVPNAGALNAAIEETARQDEFLCQYRQQEGITGCYVDVEGYVTYMDENVVSIAFLESVYLDNDYLPRIYDINIDVKTGAPINHGDMADYSPELAKKVRAQNLYQNGMDLDSWTDENILELLKGDTGVAFFTPVGLEVGFNYSDPESGSYGWLTVTIKD